MAILWPAGRMREIMEPEGEKSDEGPQHQQYGFLFRKFRSQRCGNEFIIFAFSWVEFDCGDCGSLISRRDAKDSGSFGRVSRLMYAD